MKQKEEIITPEKQFWNLLKAGLWKKKVDSNLFSKYVDWNEIVSFAITQNVSKIMADAVNLLLSDTLPPANELSRLQRLAYLNIEERKRTNHLLSDMMILLRSVGIRSVLLNGQISIYNYPYSIYGEEQKIELYVDREDLKGAYKIIKSVDSKEDIISLVNITDKLPIFYNDGPFRYWMNDCLGKTDYELVK
jgi:hypothetical protein